MNISLKARYYLIPELNLWLIKDYLINDTSLSINSISNKNSPNLYNNFINYFNYFNSGQFPSVYFKTKKEALLALNNFLAYYNYDYKLVYFSSGYTVDNKYSLFRTIEDKTWTCKFEQKYFNGLVNYSKEKFDLLPFNIKDHIDYKYYTAKTRKEAIKGFNTLIFKEELFYKLVIEYDEILNNNDF